MNVSIYIATTANGLINAGVPHDQWISDASWQSYLERLKTFDVAVIGSKTYAVMSDEEFLPNVTYIVLTHDTAKTYRSNVTPSAEQPRELIARLKQAGHQQVGILGGAEVISSFLEAQAVDELFLDLEGVLSGKGKNLLTADSGVFDLTLLDMKQLDPRTIQLHYKVTFGQE